MDFNLNAEFEMAATPSTNEVCQPSLVKKIIPESTNYVKRMIQNYEVKYLCSQTSFDKKAMISKAQLSRKRSNPFIIGENWRNVKRAANSLNLTQSKIDKSNNAMGVLKISASPAKVSKNDGKELNISVISSDVSMNDGEDKMMASYLSTSSLKSDENKNLKKRSGLFSRFSKSNFKDEVKGIWPSLKNSSEIKTVKRIGRALFKPFGSDGDVSKYGDIASTSCSNSSKDVTNISQDFDEDFDSSLLSLDRQDSINSYKNLEVNIYDFQEDNKQQSEVQLDLPQSNPLQPFSTSFHNATQDVKRMNQTPSISEDNTLLLHASSKENTLKLTEHAMTNDCKYTRCIVPTPEISSFNEFAGFSGACSKQAIEDEKPPVSWLDSKEPFKKSIKKRLLRLARRYPDKMRTLLKRRPKDRLQYYSDKHSYPLFSTITPYSGNMLPLSSGIYYDTPSTMPTFETFRPNDSSYSDQNYANSSIIRGSQNHLVLVDVPREKPDFAPFCASSSPLSTTVDDVTESMRSNSLRQESSTSDTTKYSFKYVPLPKHPKPTAKYS